MDPPTGSGTTLLDTYQTREYRQITGSAIFLCNVTRFDIAFGASQLASQMQDPQIYHLKLARQMLRYLKGTASYAVVYRPVESPRKFTLYSDATWGTEHDKKSVEGWATVRAGGAISWASNRQRSTAQSSTEAELIAANSASKEWALLEKLVHDLHENLDGPPTLWIDNTATLELIRNEKVTKRSKHIGIQMFYIRNDMVAQKRLKVEYIPTAEQAADALTKQLPAPAMQKHIQTLGMELR